MKLTTAMVLALGVVASAASPLYAADLDSSNPGQSSMSNGMANDAAEKSSHDALDKCMKESGTAKSRCVESAAQEKCKGLAGTAKSSCMKDATGKQSGSTKDSSSGMKRHQNDGAGSNNGDSRGSPVDATSGESGLPTGSPAGSGKY